MELTLVQRPFVPTRRQIECLALRAVGYSRKEIAGQLGITESTVGAHLRLLFIGSHTTDEAHAIWLFRHEIAEFLNP